jgi:serine protease Do
MAQTRSWVQSSLVSLGVGVQLPIPAAQKGKGVPVGTVKQGSPAQRGGIKAGDTVTGFDGKTISSALDLADAVSRSQPAARHSVMVLRGGKKVTVGVTGVKPSGLKRPAMPAAPGMGAGGM